MADGSRRVSVASHTRFNNFKVSLSSEFKVKIPNRIFIATLYHFHIIVAQTHLLQVTNTSALTFSPSGTWSSYAYGWQTGTLGTLYLVNKFQMFSLCHNSLVSFVTLR